MTNRPPFGRKAALKGQIILRWLMFKTTTAKLKKLMLVLFVVMLTFTLTLAVACTKKTDDSGKTDNGSDSSTEETTTVTDYQAILNGDFEFKTDDKTSYPYLSSINWTRSYGKSVNSAPSSKSSGIIDTTDDKYSSLSEGVKPVDGETVINPRTPYYYGLVKNEYDKDDEDKRVNPNVAGNKILLLNNNVAGGTAQKVTSSSSSSIAFEKYGVVSVWVKTVVKDANKGAYISLDFSVGSKTVDPVIFKNINTDGKWAKFTFCVEGSDLNNSTVKLTLGLGEGNGSLKSDYVEGFAYFDNAEFKTLTKKEFDDLRQEFSDGVTRVYENGLTANLNGKTYADNGSAKEYDEATAKNNYTEVKYGLNLQADLNAVGVDLIDGTKCSFFDNANVVGDIKTGNAAGYKSASDIASDAAVSQTLKDAIDGETGKVLYFDFNTASSATAESGELTLDADSYVGYSFYAKVKVTNKSSYGMTVKYKQLSYEAPSGENGTLDKDAVALFQNIKVYEVENGNRGDWTKYVALFSNPTQDKITFRLSFTFGIDEASEKIFPEFSLPTGYAAVTGFQKLGADTTNGTLAWSEELYNNFLSSSESVKSTLLGQYSSYSDDDDEDVSDSYNLTADSSQLAVLPFKPTSTVSGFNFKGDDDKTVHGIINGKYIENGKYGKNGVEIEDLDKLENLKTFNLNANKYNAYAQALILSNKDAASSAFVTPKATLSANSYTLITVRLKTYGDAVANVYLTGTDFDNVTKLYNVLSLKDNDGAVYELKAAADKDTKNVSASEDGFITLSFYVATGNKDIDYRVEIWNGTRDNSKNSKGTLFIDNVYVTDVSSTDVDLNGRFAYEDIIASEYGALGIGYEFKSATYTRVPTTVKYTDSDDKEATKEEKYLPTEILKQNNVTAFAYYTTVDVETERDDTTAANDDATGDTTEEDTYKVNPTGWLQVVSIILAVVLIIAVVAVIFRTNTKKTAKQKVKKQEYYHRDTREKALKKIAEDKKAINVEKDESDDKEYDYSAAENVEENASDEANETVEDTAESVDEPKADETVDFNELTQEPAEATEAPETTEVNDSEETTPVEENGDKQE